MNKSTVTTAVSRIIGLLLESVTCRHSGHALFARREFPKRPFRSTKSWFETTRSIGNEPRKELNAIARRHKGEHQSHRDESQNEETRQPEA